MGQQQLLLVILVTIIVGIATVVAINVFGSSAENANRDAVRQDVLTIGTAAQSWIIKPSMMGGGGGTFTGTDSQGNTYQMTFRDITFPSEGISTDGLTAYNMNGTYVLSFPSPDTALVTAHPSSDENYDSSTPLTATANNTMQAKVAKGYTYWVDNN